jgi:hypothetical protein
MGQILYWDTTNNQLLDEIKLTDDRINDITYSASAGQLAIRLPEWLCRLSFDRG